MATPESPIDADEFTGVDDGDEYFPSYQQSFAKSEQDLQLPELTNPTKVATFRSVPRQ